MNTIIAYCGLDCFACPAYLATKANNRAALERTAAQWREQFNTSQITADSILCDGCPADIGGRLSGYCATCEIRACAIERGVSTCAHCADYACAKLEGFLAQAPEARKTLDAIRQAL
jgi:hypothetical protein